MRNIGFLFFATGTIAVTLGMAWGIQMSVAGDFKMTPAHAHLNLLGWVTMGLFGVYYTLTPQAAEGTLPKVHYGLAFAGLVTIVPGIVMAVNETGETLAKLGSTLTILAMLLFLYIVFRNGLGSQPA
jgi:hypothetical protein